MLFLPTIPADRPSGDDGDLWRERSRNILVVEDFDEIRESLAFLLRKKGYRVYPACDGREGWRMFQRRPFDLVLTDILMPGLNGDVLAKRIHRISPQIPVIVMTAGEIDTGRTLLESGTAVGVLYKPFETQALIGILERLWPTPCETSALFDCRDLQPA
jgi:CheY-like chemotaxis protein